MGITQLDPDPEGAQKLTSIKVLDIMIDNVIQVVKRVREKILAKCVDVYKILLPDGQIVSQNDNPEGYIDFCRYTLSYLSMLNDTTPLVEALYVQMLETLEVDCPNDLTAF